MNSNNNEKCLGCNGCFIMGPTGPTGATGSMPDIVVGSVTTGEPGTIAQVIITPK